ncbi:MAG TPA: NAD(P)/FAD-dependent oxidoreductase [Gemmatimonadales bacterium]|nr:NAD(P)/FAD-dependent oxidoreductase [Gemmatimonadales bacterium]
MPGRERLDAVVVGAGPNGLSAAIALARAGRSVQLVEAAPTVGGGCRSAELTLPGFVHDVCSAVYPIGRASPFFLSLPLARHGLRWIEPDVPLAHPLDDGAALLTHDLYETARRLGPDANAYLDLVGPTVRNWHLIINELTGPLRIPCVGPRKLLAAAQFGLRAMLPVTTIARRFGTPAARALLAGCGAHSMLDLSAAGTGTFGLIFLASAHTVGWPIVAGGAGRLTGALASCLVELGGKIAFNCPVTTLDALPAHRAALLDVTPRQVLEMASERLARRAGGRAYMGQLRRYRYGPGAFKIDVALDGPIPWRDAQVLRAGTVHVGGTLEEIEAGEAEVAAGRVPQRPFVLVAQQSLFDPSRAPAGRHTAWAYCHVPNGSTVDMTDRMIAQIERFAPGFRDRILEIHRTGPADLHAYDANYIGGDIGGGSAELSQLFFRPVVRLDPYRTPDPAILLCSASTPPGAGVHGLCGWYAARSALRGVLGG